MMEFIVEQRFINGTAAMIIDMDRCTRCDDCVRACASTHNNNPRFLRHGPIEDGFMHRQCLHALPGSRLHDWLPHRRHPSGFRPRPRGDQ